MLRYALPILPALLLAAPSAAADDAPPPLAYQDVARCGVLNSLMGILVAGEPEAARTREAMALTWFALGSDGSTMSEAEQAAAFDAVHKEEGEAVVAQSAEGSARADHLLLRMKACDKLRDSHADAYRDMTRLLALASPEKFAGDVALQRQGTEPPPIPHKDLSFGDGWTFQSRYDSCIARRPLGKGAELVLGFNNFNDGHIVVKSKAFPKFDDEAEGDVFEPHNRGYQWAETPDGGSTAVFAQGVSAASYPGTAMIIDGRALIPFFSGQTGEEDGVTSYLLGASQRQFWPLLKSGGTADIVILGKKRFSVTLSASPALWAEMQTCIDQYPDG